MAEEIEFTSKLNLEFVDSMGNDLRVVNAARVSLDKHSEEFVDRDKGLIRFLMENRHTSPFEHCVVTFLVEAPIFVFREWHRHRTQSYNEMSGRYAELLPKFYVPGEERPLLQVGKPGAYSFDAGSISDYATTLVCMQSAYEESWRQYQLMLQFGIAKEVARDCLPVGIYSKMYATANLHNWLGFLNLRADEQALYEIRHLAYQVKDHLDELFPVTMAAWESSKIKPRCCDHDCTGGKL